MPNVITLEFNSKELFLIQEMMREAQANPFHPGDYQGDEVYALIKKITEALNSTYYRSVKHEIRKNTT